MYTAFAIVYRNTDVPVKSFPSSLRPYEER
jgi:hypothetical protein